MSIDAGTIGGRAEGAWTNEEMANFVQTVATFRDGLPPRQRDAFDAILATAGAAANGDDERGYLVVNAQIAILIGMLLPAVEKVREAERRRLERLY